MKPPYRVPLMSEIAALPWNGYTVASTFAGCGGSSTGYRMAGFRVLYANEFVEAARDSYAANMRDGTILDGSDVRSLTAAAILDRIGLKVGELDVLDGSPPCASFSTAGKRQNGWGKVKKYSDTEQRTDDLFFEFARLIDGLKPKVFVAENVSGLVKGSAKGYFLEILSALKACGYRVEAKLLDAQWLGVPQARQRLIFMGVREDFGVSPVFPRPLDFRYSVRDALPWIVRHGTAPPHADYVSTGRNVSQTMVASSSHPSPTITTGENKGVGYIEARVVHDTSGLWSAGDITDRPSPTITVGVNSVNSNHFRVEIEPEADISRFAIGAEWDKLKPGEQSERYFSLVKPDESEPSPTITASGGTSSLAAVTHPVEKRKFTIAELRRICGFPDDYLLTGSYGQQWERLGRAVPPVMMSHIAASVRDNVLAKIKAREREHFDVV